MARRSAVGGWLLIPYFFWVIVTFSFLRACGEALILTSKHLLHMYLCANLYALPDRFGRKPATMAASVVFLLGAGIMAGAPSWPVLAAGRLVVGLAVGLASMAVPM